MVLSWVKMLTANSDVKKKTTALSADFVKLPSRHGPFGLFFCLYLFECSLIGLIPLKHIAAFELIVQSELKMSVAGGSDDMF